MSPKKSQQITTCVKIAKSKKKKKIYLEETKNIVYEINKHSHLRSCIDST